MHFVTRRVFQLSLIILLMVPLPALAKPAITCHCFTDRSFDPAHPTVADPYFLATTRNSFVAAVFGVDKKSIVIRKQKGASTDDLWVAYWLAARSGADPEFLLQERKARGSWRQVSARLTTSAKSGGGKASEALKSGAADERLANAVVDELLLRFRFLGAPELAALRKAGAGDQELVLAGLLAAKTGQPALQLYREVSGESASWGALLQRAKIDPADIQSEITALVKKSGTPKSK